MSERRLLLLLLDTFLLSLALILSLKVRTSFLPNINAVILNLKWFVTLVLLWLAVSSVFDIYNLARAASTTYGFWASFVSSMLTSMLYLAIPWLTPPIVNRSQAFIFVFVAVMFIGVWRLLYANLFVQPAFERRALIVGAGQSGRFLVQALHSADPDPGADPFAGTGHRLVGFVDDNPSFAGQQIENLPILGGSEELNHLVESLEIDEVVIAISDTSSIRSSLFDAILNCRERSVPVVSLTSYYERLTGRIAFEHTSQNVEVATGHDESSLLRMYEIAKRIADVVGALIGLCLLSISVPLVAAGNQFFSSGPLFFYQERVGLRGASFRLIKFRSMIPDAEASIGPVWTELDDERVTSFGRLLRRTHLDELPQVINVLRGEMSLVGPRPERPEFVSQLAEEIPYYRVRHSVKPGITGWAQIHQDYGDSIKRAKEKLEYDLYYLKHMGPMLDTVVILRTVAKVIGFTGR